MRICPTCDQQFDEAERTCPDDGATLLVVHDPSQEQEDRLLGMVIDGRYRIDSKLGEGGMGAVFRGTQTAVGREVAIKVLAKGVATDVNAVKRFMQEAKAACALSHPNTITTHDFGQTEDGLLYLVMELVKGDTLAALLKREGVMRPSRAVRIAGQILHALSEAHGLGIIHRDLKPDNVLVAPRAGNPDFLKVLDFGLAKLTEGNPGNTGLTQTGQVFGTPGYMSPEQARGEVCDLRADLYAVGVMLYEMLGGRRPFDGDSPLSVLVKHIQEPPPDFTALDPPVQVADPLREVVFRTLAKPRESRYESASEMNEALVSALDASGIARTSFTGPVAPAPPSASASSPSLASGQHSAPPSSGPQLTLGSGIMGQVSLPAGSLPDAPRPASKAPLLAVGVVLLLGGGGFFAWQSGAFADGTLPDQPPEPTAAPVAAAQPRPAPPAAKPAAAPKPPAMVAVKVTAQPVVTAVAVEIYAGGELKELAVKTPGSFEVAEGANLRATFSAEGHRPETVKRVAAEGVVLHAALAREKPAAKPKVTRKWRPRPKTKPTPKPVAATPPPPKPVAAPPKPKPQPKRPARTPIDDLK